MKKNISFLPVSILFFLGVCVYFPSFRAPFFLDDYRVIVGNPAIIHPGNWPVLWDFDPLRFFTNLTFALNYAMGAEQVFGYHLVNFFIHCVNTALVFKLTQILLGFQKQEEERGSLLIAFFTAAVFLTHPLQTSAVTYLVQRATLLGCLFYLSTLILYIRFQITRKNIFYVLSLITFTLAALSKPHVLTLPLAVILIHVFFLEKIHNIRRGMLYFGGYCVIGLYIPLAYMFWKFGSAGVAQFVGSSYETPLISRGQYFLTELNVLVTYLRLAIIPVYQNLDYDYPLTTTVFNPQTLFSIVLLLGLIFLAIRLFKREKLLSFGIFWFFMTLSLESGFIPIADVIFEHRLYLPLFGFILFITVFLKNKFKNEQLFCLIMSLWLVGLSVLTLQRNILWSDRIAFLEDGAKKSPHKPRVLDNLGIAYVEEGRYEEALETFEKVLTFEPKRARTHNYIGLVYANTSQYQKALGYFTQSITLDQTFNDAYNNRGIVFMKIEKFDEAYLDFTRSILLNDKNMQAYHNRSLVLLKKRKFFEALDDINKALKLDPDNGKFYIAKGNILKEMNKLNMAYEMYAQAVKLNPQDAEGFNARGKLLFKERKYLPALSDFDRVIALTPNDTDALLNRGHIYVQLGRYEEALQVYTAIISQFPSLAKAYYYRSLVYYLTEKIDSAQKDALLAQEKGYAIEEEYLLELRDLHGLKNNKK